MKDEIDFLILQDLLELGNSIIGDFRVRDMGLLESAAARPKTSVFGDDAYPSFELKMAALMHSLARNHALIDGNKRIAWSAGRLFALMNGADIKMNIDQAEEMILQLSRGELDVAELAKILKVHLI